MTLWMVTAASRGTDLSFVLDQILCYYADTEEFVGKFANDGSLPDPNSTTNPEFKGVLQTLKDSIGVDPKTWTKMAVVVTGVSEETTTRVHRVEEMADKGMEK